VQDLLDKLAAHRRRLRLARAASAAARWAFYASILACAYLAASKVLGLTVPRALAATVLAAVPLVMAAREWARSFSVRDCAIYLDRSLGLEERLSTAVECSGALGGVQGSDAARALDRAAIPPLRLPREARFLAGSALLLGALLAVPAPERSGASGNPALEEASKAAAERLEALVADHPDLRRAAELLRQGRLEEALEILQGMKGRLELSTLDPGGAGAAAERLLAGVASEAAGLAAHLAAAGRTVHAPPPAAADRKLERQRASRPAGEEPPGPAPAAAAPEAALAALRERSDWSPRYDEAIRRYFTGKKP
jgi:predicted metal-dependent hydrolase